MAIRNPFSSSVVVAVSLATIALVAVVAAVTGYGFGLHRAPELTAPQRHRSDTFQLSPSQWASLRTEPVHAANFDALLSAEGVVSACDDASVAVFSPFSGRVTAVHAQLGQAVHRGDRLASLLAVEAAQGSADLAAAVAAAATGQRQLELAKATENRQHELVLEEAGAEKDWLQSQADLAAATNALQASQTALAAARDKASILGIQTSPRPADAGQARITSPIDGIIVQRQVVPGQVVSSLTSGGNGALFTIADLRKVIVMASTGEIEASKVRVGQPVEISAPALPGVHLHAKVAWVASVVDPASHRVAFRAELPNPDAALKPQMTVIVHVRASSPTSVAAIPGSAVIFDGEQAHCYVVVGERLLQARSLRLGRLQDGKFEVLSGLLPKDTVVTRGALFIDHVSDDTP